MGSNGLFCSVICPAGAKPLEEACRGGWPASFSGKAPWSPRFSRYWRKSSIRCNNQESGVEKQIGSGGGSRHPPPRTRRMEDYNTVMKRMMRNPYEYHHDLGEV